MSHQSHVRGDYLISTDPARLNVDLIHDFLARESYWAAGIPRNVLEKAIAGSLCFGVYEGAAQVGFARVVTDRATFAYLCDVFVVASHRGRGLATWLMESIVDHPDLQVLRRFVLVTRDAHALYAKFGFVPPPEPCNYLQVHSPNAYSTKPL